MHQPGPEVEKAPPHGGFRPHRGRPRESALWAQSLRAGATRRPVPVGGGVADRGGADIYEYLQQCHTQGLGFVVRAAQDWAPVAGPAKTPAGRLFELARAQSSAGPLPRALRGR